VEALAVEWLKARKRRSSRGELRSGRDPWRSLPAFSSPIGLIGEKLKGERKK
jgi:hypothetical protein